MFRRKFEMHTLQLCIIKAPKVTRSASFQIIIINYNTSVHDRPWGTPSLLYNGYRVIPGINVLPGRDADPSPPSSAEVKNRVELYLYSP